MRRILNVAAWGGLLLAAAMGAAAAIELDPVELDAATFERTELTVVGPEGVARYGAADLEEALDTYRLETVTPWRDRPAVFEGVLLTDLLAENGLAAIDAIRVTAENDYSVVIPRTVWQGRPVMIATRVDGRPHTRRDRGPLQFVFSMSEEPALGDQSFEVNWVWMAARIEPAD